MRVKWTAWALALCILMTVRGASARDTIETPADEMSHFTDAFVLVEENPLPGDLAWLLYMIALEPDLAEANDAVLSPLAQAAAKFAALIENEGVYYAETTRFMGMDMKAEYWMKGGQFKKLDHIQNLVFLYDGEWFYQYSPRDKTGIKMSPDDPQAATQITLIKNYTLSLVAQSNYEQLEDKKVKPFDCQVFYLDMEMMGMQGNWLYVDKETGALVKNQYGKEKGGMTVLLTKLEIGKLKDDAFLIPDSIKITGP